MNKLVVMIMGQNCERFINMCLNSVKEADAIVFCDGGSTDKTFEYLRGVHLIKNEYNQTDKQMNGKQRNFYLNYLKQNYPDDWALCIDADEVVEDLSKIKEFIQDNIPTLYSVKMRHLIGDLAHEDATTPEHFVLNRLFKISEAGEYPEVEHPVLIPKHQKSYIGPEYYQTACTTIWHMAYCPNMFEIKKRYESHLAKSNMHTPEYLKSWYFAHLFGQYPRTQFSPAELPEVILNEFKIDKDELYFTNRGLEAKHGVMVKQWNEFFKPNYIADMGCGRGPFMYYWEMCSNVDGYEISDYAINNKICNSIIEKLDISKKQEVEPFYDLVTAIDLLEHIEYQHLNTSIDNLINYTKKYILISVPVLGDPNLEADKTHKIKESKKWWIKQFIDKKLKNIEVPNHFLFKEQLMIFEK